MAIPMICCSLSMHFTQPTQLNLTPSLTHLTPREGCRDPRLIIPSGSVVAVLSGSKLVCIILVLYQEVSRGKRFNRVHVDIHSDLPDSGKV